MRTTIALPLFALGLLACSALAAEADSYSKAVQQSCASDYKKYCGEYGLESTALRGCMDRAGSADEHGSARLLASRESYTQAATRSARRRSKRFERRFSTSASGPCLA